MKKYSKHDMEAPLGLGFTGVTNIPPSLSLFYEYINSKSCGAGAPRTMSPGPRYHNVLAGRSDAIELAVKDTSSRVKYIQEDLTRVVCIW